MPIKSRIHDYSTALSIAALFLFMQATNWPPLYFWGWWGGGNFLDSWQVLKSADCYRKIGIEVYDTSNSCMLYAYGRPLLWLMRILHIGGSQTFLVGFSFLIILALTIGWMIRALQLTTLRSYLLISIIVLSPPILLLGDRGNFDSLTVGAIFLAIWFLNRNKPISALFALFFVTLFKYYTLPLMLVVGLINKEIRVRITAVLFLIIAVISIRRDLAITEFKFSSNTPHLTFGLGHEFLFFGKYDRLNWVLENSKIFGLLLVGLIIAISYLLFHRLIPSEINTTFEKNIVKIYIFSTVILLTCYFSGFNADYRLIFFVFSALALSQLVHEIESYKTTVYIFMAAILWLTFPSGDLEIFGDFFLSIYVGSNIALIAYIFQRGKLEVLTQ